MSREDHLRKATANVIADVWMYPTDAGGRSYPADLGWGCPCMISQMHPLVGYDAWPLLGDKPLLPGSKRRLGFLFLSEDGAEAIRRAGSFFLWEGGFIGEGRVVTEA